MILHSRDDTEPIDDIDSRLSYAGSWEESVGSTRQWGGGTIHSTNQYGASVSFRFRGTDFIVYDTISSGSGTMSVDISIDGGSPARVTRTSGSDAVYVDKLYQSSVMTNTIHTVVITNRGQSSDSPFLFDKVDLHAPDTATMLTMPPPQATTTKPSTAAAQSPTVTTIQGQVTVTNSGSTITVTQSNVSPDSVVSNSPSNSVSPALSPGVTEHVTTQSQSLTAALSQSTTVFLTTDSHGSTVISTRVSQFATSPGNTITVSGAASTSTVNGNAPGASSLSGDASKSSSMPIVMAGVFGGLFAGLLLTLALFCIRRRRRAQKHIIIGDDNTRAEPKRVTRAAMVRPEPFRLDEQETISPDTPSPPDNHYGYSKSHINQNLRSRSENQLGGQMSPAESSSHSSTMPSPQADPSESAHSEAGYSTSAQSTSTRSLLHRHSTSLSHATVARSPTSERESTLFDPPPAYQPRGGSHRSSDIKRRSLLSPRPSPGDAD